MNAKKLIVGAAVALMLLVGAGVAYASSLGDDDSSEQQTTGPGIEKAKTVALDYANGGQVSGTEVGDEEGYYEVEIIRDDGSQVDVHLDRDFNVLSMPADHEGPNDSEDAPNDGGG